MEVMARPIVECLSRTWGEMEEEKRKVCMMPPVYKDEYHCSP